MANRTPSSRDIWKARLQLMDWKAVALGIGVVLLMGAGLAVMAMRLPEHRGYHLAEVRDPGIHQGSTGQYTLILAELDNGRRVWVQSRHFDKTLTEGDSLCVDELRGILGRRVKFQQVAATRCAEAGKTR